ncbi:MAG: hypothetical protein AAF658_21840, partial [Myxococcota bacterium]
TSNPECNALDVQTDVAFGVGDLGLFALGIDSINRLLAGLDPIRLPDEGVVELFSPSGEATEVLSYTQNDEPLGSIFNTYTVTPNAMEFDVTGSLPTSVSFTFDTFGREEGAWVIQSTQLYRNERPEPDRRVVRRRSLTIRRELPTIQFNRPLQGEAVCPDSIESNVVSLDVTIAGPSLGTARVETMQEGRTQDRLSAPLSGSRFEGTLTTFDLSRIDRERDFSVEVQVESGSLLGCETLDIEGLASTSFTASEPRPSVFSPNGDGLGDTTEIDVSAPPDLLLEARVETVDGQSVGRFTQVASATQDMRVLRWGGDGVDDGTYIGVLRSSDGCGAQRVERRTLEVDTTPPVVAVTSPESGASVAG